MKALIKRIRGRFAGQWIEVSMTRARFQKLLSKGRARQFTYREAVREVSVGGTPETRKILMQKIKEYPEEVKALQDQIRKDYGNKITLYRATRGKKLKGIESFTESPEIAKEIRADVKIDVSVDKIVGHYKYQPHEMWRSAHEKEVLVRIKK